LSPYAPHFCEEIWEKIGYSSSITKVKFPQWDKKYLVESEIVYPVSFNGKMRFKVNLPADMEKNEIEKIIMSNEKTKHYIGSSTPKRIIIVPKKIINIVI